MKKQKLYDVEKPFEKWLFTICINTYRDSIKRFEKKENPEFSKQRGTTAFSYINS